MTTTPEEQTGDDDAAISDEAEPMPPPAAGAAPPPSEPPKAAPGMTLSDLLRKAVLAGMGAVSVTEEGIRNRVGDIKVHKEVLTFVTAQAERTREEASRVLRKELRRFLNSDAFKQQMMALLSGVTLEIKAEVRLRPDPKGDPKPEVDAAAKFRVRKPEGDTPA